LWLFDFQQVWTTLFVGVYPWDLLSTVTKTKFFELLAKDQYQLGPLDKIRES